MNNSCVRPQWAILFSLLTFILQSAFAVDGTAVSTLCKHGSYPGSTVLNASWWGKIVRYDIANSKAGTETVIYDGMGRYPTLCQDGKKVAFFRNGSADGNGETLCDGYGNCGWVSVMNIDGSGLKDLVALQDAGNRNANSMDWPVGDWIYYQKDGSKEIWRVNVSDASQNEKVCTYENDFRVWALNGNAQFAITQMSATAEANIPHYFPPKTGLVWIRRNHPSGCNPAMSPSGMYLTHFLGTTHTTANFRRYAPEQDTCYDEGAISNDEMSKWAGTNVGRGMDWPRWSCNSDKWVCFKIGWSCDGILGRFSDAGSNVTLVNWVDKQAIKLSDNKLVCNKGSLKQRSDAGDFWVEGPQGKYEAITGEWVNYGQAVSAEKNHNLKAKIRLRTMNAAAIYYDCAGRRINKSAVNLNNGVIIHRSVSDRAAIELMHK